MCANGANIMSQLIQAYLLRIREVRHILYTQKYNLNKNLKKWVQSSRIFPGILLRTNEIWSVTLRRYALFGIFSMDSDYFIIPSTHILINLINKFEDHNGIKNRVAIAATPQMLLVLQLQQWTTNINCKTSSKHFAVISHTLYNILWVWAFWIRAKAGTIKQTWKLNFPRAHLG